VGFLVIGFYLLLVIFDLLFRFFRVRDFSLTICCYGANGIRMKKGIYHLHFALNGEEKSLDIDPGISVLELVRDILGLKGTKEGCGIGECGACTVVVDGRAVNACLMFAAQLDGRELSTVEGLARDDAMHPIQQAFADNHAVQCGFCTPGFLMSTHALLSDNPQPTRKEIVKAVAGNLCRCTGYQSIIAGIEDAVDKCRKQEK
jgi:carbon-monoxide dehydrogenase small subunit